MPPVVFSALIVIGCYLPGAGPPALTYSDFAISVDQTEVRGRVWVKKCEVKKRQVKPVYELPGLLLTHS